MMLQRRIKESEGFADKDSAHRDILFAVTPFPRQVSSTCSVVITNVVPVLALVKDVVTIGRDNCQSLSETVLFSSDLPPPHRPVVLPYAPVDLVTPVLTPSAFC